MYVAEVRIELKPGVADPEGANTKKALELLGFQGVRNVNAVHAFRIELDAKSPKDAETQVAEMCKRLLVNPVIHRPDIRIASANGRAKPAKKATRKAATPSKVMAKKAKATTHKKAAKAERKAAKKPAAKRAASSGRKNKTAKRR